MRQKPKRKGTPNVERVSRRSFFYWTAGGLLALPLAALTGCLRQSGQGEPPARHLNGRVVVIGAGVAGLAAAAALHAADVPVTVIEARDRIGGRVWTDRSMGGIPLDMGASWIQGTRGNPLTTLADARNIPRVATDDEQLVLYDAAGTRMSARDFDAYYATFEQVMATAAAVAEDRDTDMSLSAAIADALRAMGGRLTQREQQMLSLMVNITIEHEFAGSADQLSAWWLDDDAGFAGDNVLFPAGYDWLPTALAEGLDIRLGTPVDSIAYAADGVLVTAGDAIYRADCAVVTVPLGVLKANHITFSPALPSPKQDAIQRLAMGVLNKLYLRFDTAFWDTDADWIYATDPAQRGRWTSFVNMQPAVNAPVLLGFNAADYGIAVEDFSDADIVGEAMATLRTLYGDAIPAPIGFLRTAWNSDPYALGAYSYYAVGSSPEDRTALEAPVSDVLFFAGEATRHDYPATVHGALLSGQAVAADVLARLR